MSIHLSVEDDHSRDIPMNNRTWGALMALAFRFGWKPAGTVDPIYADPGFTPRVWDGNYCSSDGQQITESDAHSLGTALEQALVNDFRAPFPMDESREEAEHALIDASASVRAVEAFLGLSAGKEPEIVEYVSSSDGRDFLGEIIGILMKGAVRIL